MLFKLSKDYTVFHLLISFFKTDYICFLVQNKNVEQGVHNSYYNTLILIAKMLIIWGLQIFTFEYSAGFSKIP